MSSVLCASMLMGSVTPVFAATNETQTTSSNEKKEVEVLYNKSASYFVTIPKTITLDSNKESTYNVKVEGDIPSDKNVYVAPEDAISQTDEIDFYMHDQSTKHPKADVVAIVTQNKDTWDFEEVQSGYEETTNKISASQLTAGNWKGTFNFNINMKGVSFGEDVTLTSDNLATYGIANTGDVVIPSVVTNSDGMKHKVTQIGNKAFSKCSKLTSITIPDSVTSIGVKAFGGCSGLTSITIPNSVTYLGGYAFFACTSLENVIYNGITYDVKTDLKKVFTTIDDTTFEGTKLYDDNVAINVDNASSYGISLTGDVVIPEKVTKDGKFYKVNNVTWSNKNGNGLLFNNNSVTSLYIPDSVTKIYEVAMQSSIQSVHLSSNITELNQRNFYNCENLTTINLPNKITSIGEQSFFGCKKLTSITLPDNLQKLGPSCFYNSGLSSVTYKGITYTSKSQLEQALKDNGVILKMGYGNGNFDGTNLTD